MSNDAAFTSVTVTIFSEKVTKKDLVRVIRNVHSLMTGNYQGRI